MDRDNEKIFMNNDTNWSTYKYYVETYSYKIEADGILDGSEKEPEIPEIDGDNQEWLQRNVA